MLRDTLIDESVIRSQQIQSRTVFENNALEKHFGLSFQTLAEIVVEIGKDIFVRPHTLHVAQIQPLARKVGAKSPRTLIGEHTFYLLLEDGRVLQPSLHSN